MVVERRRPEAGGRKPEAGSRRPEAGGRKPEAGSRKPEAGGRRPEAGGRRPAYWRPEAGGRKPQAGSRRPEAGGRKLEAGSRRPEAGSRRPEAGGRRPEAARDRQDRARSRRAHTVSGFRPPALCPLVGQPIPTLHSFTLSKLRRVRELTLSFRTRTLERATRGMTLAHPPVRQGGP